MSKSFTKIFSLSRNFIFDSENTCRIENNKNNVNLGIKMILLASLASIHFGYVMSTNQKEETIIKKKYKIVRSGFTEFMIIDNKDRHFNVNNSLWYWKWNSIEDWNNIKEGDDIKIRYYGWRVPSLGLFPNIYMSSDEKFLD